MSFKREHWQCQLVSPSERLAHLRNSGHLSDITITFPGHSKSIQAHRLLLAMSSPAFEAMVYGPLAKDGQLALPEDPPEAFEWLLNHLYKNETQLSDARLATKVYLLASKYQLDNVCKICSQVLLNDVTPENFPDVFEFATLKEISHSS
ncbi:BTB/POZ domain-containing protein 6-like [Penaeus chinensis]|uniref:BTB/POZ domain-containing protein 6-like n=1 Tax=Penaeus chinensis TaxID=139456 RepID=UPI001FB785C5|nr:BTB/POZ domain-containing protein 6-like [Penaeus chinensis]